MLLEDPNPGRKPLALREARLVDGLLCRGDGREKREQEEQGGRGAQCPGRATMFRNALLHREVAEAWEKSGPQ